MDEYMNIINTFDSKTYLFDFDILCINWHLFLHGWSIIQLTFSKYPTMDKALC